MPAQLTTPSGCSCSQEAGNVALPAGSTPYVPAAKRRCLGALPKDLSTLTFSEEEVAASNGYRPQPSDFERSMMVRPHKDLLRGGYCGADAAEGTSDTECTD